MHRAFACSEQNPALLPGPSPFVQLTSANLQNNAVSRPTLPAHLKTLILTVVVAICASSAGFMMGNHSANKNTAAENSISMLVAVGGYSRGRSPGESADKMDHVYHLALSLLASSGLSREELVAKHEAFPTHFRLLQAGRMSRNLPVFDPAFLPEGSHAPVEDFLRDFLEVQKEPNPEVSVSPKCDTGRLLSERMIEQGKISNEPTTIGQLIALEREGVPYVLVTLVEAPGSTRQW